MQDRCFRGIRSGKNHLDSHIGPRIHPCGSRLCWRYNHCRPRFWAGTNGGDHIHIFGTPGQERFEFAREVIGKGMDGAILIIDATSPADDFIHHLYNSLTSAKIPFVIFLNKCDTIGARPELIEKEFHAAIIRKVSENDRKQSLEALCSFAQTLPPQPNGYSPHH